MELKWLAEAVVFTDAGLGLGLQFPGALENYLQ